MYKQLSGSLYSNFKHFDKYKNMYRCIDTYIICKYNICKCIKNTILNENNIISNLKSGRQVTHKI